MDFWTFQIHEDFRVFFASHVICWGKCWFKMLRQVLVQNVETRSFSKCDLETVSLQSSVLEIPSFRAKPDHRARPGRPKLVPGSSDPIHQRHRRCRPTSRPNAKDPPWLSYWLTLLSWEPNSAAMIRLKEKSRQCSMRRCIWKTQLWKHGKTRQLPNISPTIPPFHSISIPRPPTRKSAHFCSSSFDISLLYPLASCMLKARQPRLPISPSHRQLNECLCLPDSSRSRASLNSQFGPLSLAKAQKPWRTSKSIKTQKTAIPSFQIFPWQYQQRCGGNWSKNWTSATPRNLKSRLPVAHRGGF